MPDNFTIFEGRAVDAQRRSAVEVQQRSAATLPSDTDLIRPTKAYELHQRPASTGMQLVHTEEVTASIPVSPTQLSGRERRG